MRNYIIPIYKPQGVTSAASLSTIKHNVEKKVGHTGTLDREAEGLIIALTGKYTKLTEEYMNLKKTYLAEITFGKETDTLDRDGEVIALSDYIPSRDEIEKTLSNFFLGEIMQTPPLYSALKKNGKRLSDIARSGEEVSVEPRNITIYKNEIVSYENGVLKARFVVSRGTYIRSIARDLGLKLNSRAYMSGLVREQIGPFTISDAIRSDDKEAITRNYTRERKKVVLSIGMFDGVHKGHQKLLRRLQSEAVKSNADSLVITFDTIDKSSFKSEQLLTTAEKVKKIYSLGIDEVRVLKWDDELKHTSGASFLLSLMKEVEIVKMVVGEDFRIGSADNPITLKELILFLYRNDIIVEPYVLLQNGEKLSSTYIRKLIADGKKEEALRYL